MSLIAPLALSDHTRSRASTAISASKLTAVNTARSRISDN
jgi:hypothetical protein